MTSPYTGPTLIGLGVGYLLFFFVAINTYSYEIWGAVVVIPVLFTLGTIGLLRMFRGDLAHLAPIMIAGLGAKFAGAGARYWVGFEAYDGVIDAQGYHAHGRGLVVAVREGQESVLSLIPSETGTPFMEVFTGFVYYFAGTSRLGGFMVFAFLAYWGTAWFVKAAAIAVPGLVQKRYAVLCVLSPSLVYWPSSIGKDAWMVMTLGLATYGFARILASQGIFAGVLMSAIGLLGASMVRPHLAGLWLAGLIPALAIGVLVSRTGHDSASGGEAAIVARRAGVGERMMLLGVVAFAAVGLSLAAGTTVRYLNPNDEEGGTQAVTSILDETTRRSTAGGSNFEPPSTASPANWPVAVTRTLTRPLLFEARGLAQLIAGGEMTLFLGFCVVSWKRVRGLPRLLLRNRFLAFGMTVLFLGGLAFSSFANLGILTRQKSILFPFLLLLPCLPIIAKRTTSGDQPHDVEFGRRAQSIGFSGSAAFETGAATPDYVAPARRRTPPVSGLAWEPTQRRAGSVIDAPPPAEPYGRSTAWEGLRAARVDPADTSPDPLVRGPEGDLLDPDVGRPPTGDSEE